MKSKDQIIIELFKLFKDLYWVAFTYGANREEIDKLKEQVGELHREFWIE